MFDTSWRRRRDSDDSEDTEEEEDTDHENDERDEYSTESDSDSGEEGISDSDGLSISSSESDEGSSVERKKKSKITFSPQIKVQRYNEGTITKKERATLQLATSSITSHSEPLDHFNQTWFEEFLEKCTQGPKSISRRDGLE